MHALVADVAVAEVPEPVPVVRHDVAVMRLLWGRAEPEVEIEFGRSQRDRLLADALTRLVAEPTRDDQLAELAGFDGGGELRPIFRRAALRAVLYDATILTRGLYRDASFVNVVAARLLDVDVLAGLARPNGHERVPVVRRGDRHGIDVLIVERFANVLDLLRLVGPLLLVDLGEVLRVRARVGIDEVGELDVVHAEVGARVGMAATVQPGDGDANPIVGAEHSARRLRAADDERGAERSGTGGFQKLTTRGTRRTGHGGGLLQTMDEEGMSSGM